MPATSNNRQPAPHGTDAAYQHHRSRGEDACGPCKAARAARQQEYRQRPPTVRVPVNVINAAIQQVDIELQRLLTEALRGRQ